MMKDGELYAHTPPTHRSNDEGQLLLDHLQGVADLTAEFAGAFGMADAGRLLGMTHDLGKASADFQAYLRRGVRGGGPGHSDPGAAATAHVLEPLIPIVQGHHGGLPDHGDSEARLGNAVEAHTQTAENLSIALGIDGRDAFDTPLKEREREALLRMLLSCLVDADRLNTEVYDRGETREVDHPNIAGYLRCLNGELAGFRDSSNGVDAVRREVQEDCREKAALPPGFFRLTVPTGGGKTLASLLFALEHAKRHGMRRVVVAVPYTTVVEQTAKTYADVFGETNVLEHHAAYNEEGTADEKRPDEDAVLRRRWATENWDHPLIVTTNVQLMDSLLSRRTSKVRKIHRLARSVIVLDEAQTLPAELLQAHFDVLGWLVRHAGATVVLCTATQPDFGAIQDAPEELRNAREIVEEPERHFVTLDRVRFSLIGPKTHDEIAEELADVDQGLVVVNSRDDSVKIFRALERDPDARYLSTYLCPLHRRERVAEIKARLKAGEPVRVVSTQVIETGVDASFPDLWRARGPLEAVVQAAGRCNRNDEMKPDKGRVRVFDMVDGKMPPGEYQTRTEAASKWLDVDLSKIASPEVQTAYFRRLLKADTGSLGTDRNREKRWLQDQRAKLDYPFTEKHGRMIEDEGIAIVVASWRPDDTGPLLQDAIYRPGAIRKLAPYTVSLRKSFINKPDIKHYFHDHECGVKVYDGPYNAQLGVGGDGALDPEGLIVM